MRCDAMHTTCARSAIYECQFSQSSNRSPHRICQQELHISIANKSIAWAFQVDPKVVRHVIKQGYSILDDRG